MVSLDATTVSKIATKYHDIHDWDMALVKDYLYGRYGYELKRLERMEIEYKKYIALAVASPDGEKAPISAEVDPFWHAHILHTRNYVAMSEALGLKYVHHTPSPPNSSERLNPQYQNITLAQMTQVFGTLDPEFWSPDRQVCRRDCLPGM